MPGAEQLVEIREIFEHLKFCVILRPQFNPDIIKAVAKDMNIKIWIDPLGATLNPGKSLYLI